MSKIVLLGKGIGAGALDEVEIGAIGCKETKREALTPVDARTRDDEGKCAALNGRRSADGGKGKTVVVREVVN